MEARQEAATARVQHQSVPRRREVSFNRDDQSCIKEYVDALTADLCLPNEHGPAHPRNSSKTDRVSWPRDAEYAVTAGTAGGVASPGSPSVQRSAPAPRATCDATRAQMSQDDILGVR